VRYRAWYIYPVVAAVATAVYFASGHHPWMFNVIGLSSPVLILVAIAMWKPEHKAPWLLFALGQFLFISGDVVAYNYAEFHHLAPGLFTLVDGSTPYPAISDALYLSVYPCLVAGLILMIRRRSSGRDGGSLIDAAMIAIGVGTVSWVFLISPYVSDTTLSVPAKLVSMGYPLMDMLLLTVAIRLAFGAGKRPPSLYLMVAGIVSLFTVDAIYGWLQLNQGYVPGSGYLEIGWIAFYVLFGAAALHPSMRHMSDRTAVESHTVGVGRLALLGAASLLAPMTEAVQIWRGDMANMSVVLAATITLFLLAMIRMAGLVQQQQRSAEREKALREVGAALVTATNRDGIHHAAIDAALVLAGDGAAIRMCEDIEEGSQELLVVAGQGGVADANGVRFTLSGLQAGRRERLLHNDAYTIPASETPMRTCLHLSEEDDGTVLVAPLFMREALRGLMIVATPDEMPTTVVDALRALSSQAALALESAALTEDLLMRQSEKRFASLVQNSSDVVTVVDADTSIRYASPSVQRVLGIEPELLEGTRFIDLVHPDDKTRVLGFLTATGDGHTLLMECRVRRQDGEYIFTETLRTNLLHDESVGGVVLNTRDISERKAFEEQLSHQAFHDAVTGLANRALFRDRVTHAIERQGRDRKPIAVLFMDLDDFKTINDSLGHAAGDQLLREVGERLKECLRAADTAARLGGDEFAILLEDGGEGILAVDVADRMMQMLEEPFALEGKEVFVRASVGIAVADGDDSGDAEELLRNADVAMYMAKEKGKGRYQVFEPAMHDTALKRLELKADLQRALEHGEFVLHYQPVIELDTGKISGVEALIRWIHPVRGLVPPLDFIPLAEETGLIVPIGRWVLGEACRMAVTLKHEFPNASDCHMAVNLSARQLARPEIVDEVSSILTETGLDPGSLILEITESVMMQDMELSIDRLTELKGLGVQLAIDDFGTGYSSLNYVRRFPVDILKVDKSFIDGVSEEGESSALTAAVIELAGILNLKPVAEGIERPDQLERLLELKCDLGQGFLFAKPLPPAELNALMQERSDMHAEVDALAKG
jgi:diguanylate cyclase (GGDEF)-like protein/PAS domain S-box-containing protein